MKDLNIGTIVGRLTKDPELKETKNGSSVMNFSIASNDNIKENDEYKDRPDFFDCVMWGKLAESLCKYMTKGTRVGFSYRLRQDRWKNEKDETRSKVILKVIDINLLGNKSDSKQAVPASNDNSKESTPEMVNRIMTDAFEDDGIPI